jgi:very-short-patch-repair endonuclease
MKGSCDIVKCQICNQEMSFGRIKRHIKSKHIEIINVDQYIKKYWSTLPLHKLCEVCNKNIVYKYKTCSPECRSKLKHKHKGKPKPKGFMSPEHKNKISKSHQGKIIPKEVGIKISKSSKGVSRNKGKQPMLGKKCFHNTKKKISNSLKKYYKQGNEPWSKNNSHSPETIERIFKHKPMNKLESFVSSILDENQIPHHFQFFLKAENDICKSYDFKIKNKKILIEIDGDYWHGGPGVKKHFFKLNEVKLNDELKNQIAQQKGYKLLRFWESDIYNQPEEMVKQIKKLL